MIILTLGYFEALIVRHENGREAVFPGRAPEGRWRRIITGARDKYGQCRVMGSMDVRRFFRITPQLKNVGDTVTLDDDKGLFDRITADDILAHSARAHGLMPVAPLTLAKAVSGNATQRRTR